MIPITKMEDKDNERIFLLGMYSSDDISNEHKIIDSCYYAVRMHCISLHTYCLLIRIAKERTLCTAMQYKITNITSCLTLNIKRVSDI
jgi:hypothetical protein